MSTRQETHPLIDLSDLDLDTPEGAAAARLRATTAEGLVDAVIRLTHRIHTETAKQHTTRTARGQVMAAWSRQTVSALRAQRDLCRAELIRRAGA